MGHAQKQIPRRFHAEGATRQTSALARDRRFGVGSPESMALRLGRRIASEA